jgi:hypothetical protein
MGAALTDADEGLHAPGGQINWNESRYIDFWDPVQKVGGWFRMGQRPNAGYAEMSACINLPDGRIAFFFERAKIAGNSLTAGNLVWEIGTPWRSNRVRYRGEMILFDNAWDLTDPKRAFTTAPRVHADIDLTCVSTGLGTVMGQDQDHVDLIFLPGQADFHYQHLGRTTGTVKVGDSTWQVDGRGGKDHSWGPRNWHAKIYLRWLICGLDDDNGFMLTRAVGPTKKTRSGFLLEGGAFNVVDGYEMKNHYAGAPNYELLKTEVTIKAGARTVSATGTPRAWLPLRHRQQDAEGKEAILRIVKSPADWVLADGRTGAGMCEYHDLMADGKPVALDD